MKTTLVIIQIIGAVATLFILPRIKQVKLFKVAIFAVFVILASCSNKKGEAIRLDTIRIELNICDSPFNAIPNDTLSDVKAFKLALDVLNNVSVNALGIYYILETSIVVPVGKYIIDDDMEWGEATIKIKQPDITTQSVVEGMVVDVKSEMNLNHFSYWNSKVKEPTPAKVFYDTLSNEELEILKTI